MNDPKHPNDQGQVDPPDILTLRDWFAGQMLAAMLGTETLQEQLELAIRKEHSDKPEDERRAIARRIIARRCYLQADAMLVARKAVRS